MVQPIGTSFINPRKINSKINAPDKKKTDLTKVFNNNNFFINFKGYYPIQVKKSFDETIYENYFRLPKVNLKDGSPYQIMPDITQVEAAKELYKGNSVLYDVPTGTGKTALAHYIITKNLNENKKSAYTIPIKALANDKYREFCKIYGKNNVGLLTGDRKINPKAPIVIMTTEIYDNGIDFEKNNPFKTVVFDEAHYIGDKERGSAWEQSIMKSQSKGVQILLLSATIGNSDEFAGWSSSLNSETDFKKIELAPENRFVPLIYSIYKDDKFMQIIDGKINLEETLNENQKRALETIYKNIFNKDIDYVMNDEDYNCILDKLKQIFKEENLSLNSINLGDFKNVLKRNIQSLSDDEIEQITSILLKNENKTIKTIHSPYQKDPDYPLLAKKLKEENMLPAIIYKLSKGASYNIARSLKEADLDLVNEEEKEEIKKIIQKYKKNNKYLGTKVDYDMLLSGIAVHHSGKMPDYKELVEELFSKKLVKIVTATSTLGVGINTPTKTTVISDLSYIKPDSKTEEIEHVQIGKNSLDQMMGRAGRRGIDLVGNVIVYNMKTPKSGFKKDTDDPLKPDELKLFYQYMQSPSQNLRSAYKPSCVMLADYYDKNNNDNNLKNIIQKSFKVYLAKNPEKESKQLYKKFERCSNLLLKQGYIYKNYQNEICLTPKGMLLKLSQGANPLMLSSLIYDEKLNDITPVGLAQIAGYIANSSLEEEAKEMEDFIKKRYSSAMNKNQDKISEFEKMNALFKNKEEKVRKASKEAKLDFEENTSSRSIAGYISHLWAYLNDISEKRIENYEYLINYYLQHTKEVDTPEKREFNSSIDEGDVFKIIAQTITTLKQIQRICDFAISNEELFPNIEYYQNLKETAQKALKLTDVFPINCEV